MIAQIQIFAIKKVGICSDTPPYQLFRYDISANSFSCAMLNGSLLDSMAKVKNPMHYDPYCEIITGL